MFKVKENKFVKSSSPLISLKFLSPPHHLCYPPAIAQRKTQSTDLLYKVYHQKVSEESAEYIGK